MKGNWIETAQRRYRELVDGTVEGVPGPLVLERLRTRLGGSASAACGLSPDVVLACAGLALERRSWAKVPLSSGGYVLSRKNERRIWGDALPLLNQPISS